MLRLGRRDLRAVLDCLRMTYATLDLEAFPRQVIAGLHRLGIYNENYLRTGVEYQMTFMVQSLQRPSPTTIAIALDRGPRDSDFTERDRFMLSLLRPHLMTAYANAETMSALRCRAPETSGAPETRPREI